MQRNQGMFDVHSSCRLSPDLNIVPVGVEELMESLAVTLVHNNNNNNMTTAQITGYSTPRSCVSVLDDKNSRLERLCEPLSGGRKVTHIAGDNRTQWRVLTHPQSLSLRYTQRISLIRKRWRVKVRDFHSIQSQNKQIVKLMNSKRK